MIKVENTQSNCVTNRSACVLIRSVHQEIHHLLQAVHQHITSGFMSYDFSVTCSGNKNIRILCNNSSTNKIDVLH